MKKNSTRRISKQKAAEQVADLINQKDFDPHDFLEENELTQHRPRQPFDKVDGDSLKVICELLGEDSGGPVFTGYMILLLEHAAALAFEGRLVELEAHVLRCSESMIASNRYALRSACDSLRQRALESAQQLAASHAGGAQ